MGDRKQVNIAIIGAGFLAETRGRCYAKTGGIEARVVAVADVDTGRSGRYCKKFKVRDAYTDFRELLKRPDIDIVDICAPNHLHRPMVIAAAEAGKHIVCTKPLTAYVGQDLHAAAEDSEISSRSRRDMLAMASDDAEAKKKKKKKKKVLTMDGA